MSSNEKFQYVSTRGWDAGLWNLVRKENRDWWGTRSWLVRGLLWLLILDGFALGVILISSDPVMLAKADPETARQLADRTTVPVDKFFEIAGIALALGVVILAQDEIIGEKRTGTAAWVLSKPVSRSAFVLSKILGNLPGIALVMVLWPGGVAYLMISLFRSSPLPPAAFLAGLAALFLSLLVFLALTVMLGTLSDSRGLVIGIPLILILGFQIYMMFLSPIYEFLPQALTMSGGGATLSTAATLALGQPLPSITPLVANSMWILLFVAVAVWRIRREEL